MRSPSGAAEPEAGDSRRKSSPTMRGLRRTDLSWRTSRFMPAGASRPRGGPRAEACNFRATEPAHEGVQRGTGIGEKPITEGLSALSCPPVPPLYCAPEPEVAGSNPAARASREPLTKRVLGLLRAGRREGPDNPVHRRALPAVQPWPGREDRRGRRAGIRVLARDAAGPLALPGAQPHDPDCHGNPLDNLG